MKKIFIILSLSFLLLNGCSRITPLKGSQYQKKPFSGYQDCLAKTTGRYNFSELALNLFAGIGGLVMMYKSGKADSFWGFLGSSMLSGAGFDIEKGTLGHEVPNVAIVDLCRRGKFFYLYFRNKFDCYSLQEPKEKIKLSTSFSYLRYLTNKGASTYSLIDLIIFFQ